MSLRRYARFAWFVLAFNVVGIAWGALVRATGSGAGCGDHWPDCGGTMWSAAWMIELTHRALTGLDAPLVIALVVGARRAFPKGHAVRAAAAWSLVLLVTEALLGAALVKLGYVKDDMRPMRAAWMGLHLVNTNFMIGAMALTAWHASGGTPLRVRGRSGIAWTIAGAIAMVLVAGMTGAIAALADTLFPSASLPDGLRADAAAGAHLFLRLRGLHPLAAVLAAVAAYAAAGIVAAKRASRAVAKSALVVRVAVAAQVAAGVVNLLLLAPVGMQLVHLVLADALWIALVVMSAAALGDEGAERLENAAMVAAHG